MLCIQISRLLTVGSSPFSIAHLAWCPRRGLLSDYENQWIVCSSNQNAENTSEDIKQVSQAGTALPPQCLASESWQTWSHISETKEYFHKNPYLESQKRRTSLKKMTFYIDDFPLHKTQTIWLLKNILVPKAPNNRYTFLFVLACLFCVRKHTSKS